MWASQVLAYLVGPASLTFVYKIIALVFDYKQRKLLHAERMASIERGLVTLPFDGDSTIQLALDA